MNDQSCYKDAFKQTRAPVICGGHDALCSSSNWASIMFRQLEGNSVSLRLWVAILSRGGAALGAGGGPSATPLPTLTRRRCRYAWRSLKVGWHMPSEHVCLATPPCEQGVGLTAAWKSSELV